MNKRKIKLFEAVGTFGVSMLAIAMGLLALMVVGNVVYYLIFGTLP